MIKLSVNVNTLLTKVGTIISISMIHPIIPLDLEILDLFSSIWMFVEVLEGVPWILVSLKNSVKWGT